MWGIKTLTDSIRTDFLVVGAGVAGLRAAIELAPRGQVLVVAKDSLKESSSEYAQGGIAVALSDEDEVSLHESDTLAAGDGLCDPAAVKVLVEQGPVRIQELIDWGTQFDRDGTKLLFAREGAHSRSRVLHSHGDSTGREISRALYKKAASLPNVTFRSYSAVVDLLTCEGRVAGAYALERESGKLVPIRARAVLLATGGMGRLYRDTTNPDVATGDGVAMAWRCGATAGDLEFIQFHPTALHVEGAPRFLLSEALRGEGAALLNASGERFMQRYHPMAELAPRDVVSRSIMEEMRRENSRHVHLDLSGRGNFVRDRFPRIHETCLNHGIDLDQMPAPVLPAAHYAMGGVVTDLWGRTGIDGLYAAGEAACTGVHGANRLASNSLLEGIVYGARAGQAMEESEPAGGPAEQPPDFLVPDIGEDDLRWWCWTEAGLLRSGEGLRKLIARMDRAPLSKRARITRAGAELRGMHQLVKLIARCALAREESRGAHRRMDYPESSEALKRHSRVCLASGEIAFVP
ncbi:MAG: L-aspartate oxidase [Candidatus Solibacter sp.]|nr:L-aspartate oxidase [Candidatus Solibacter sp.]